MGTALVEVSPKPHRGCAKFRDRFGEDALKWVNHPPFLARRLRGVNCFVVEPGVVVPGDPIENRDW